MPLTQQQLQNRLNLYLEAEKKILLNQSYTIGNRTYTRANLASVRDEIRKLRSELAGIANSGTMRVRRVIMRDD